MAKTLKIKLLKRNLKLPLQKRISLERIKSLEYTARMRGNSVALLASIHEEIKPKIEAEQKAWDYIENRRKDFAGYVTNHEDGHYISHVYTMADSSSQEPDLAKENDEKFAMIVRCQELKEQQIKEKISEDFN